MEEPTQLSWGAHIELKELLAQPVGGAELRNKRVQGSNGKLIYVSQTVGSLNLISAWRYLRGMAVAVPALGTTVNAPPSDSACDCSRRFTRLKISTVRDMLADMPRHTSHVELT